MSGARGRLLTSFVSIRAVAGAAVLAMLSVVLLPLTAQAQVLAPDDAGSGRDAGRTFATAVPVEIGKRYTGSFTTTGVTGSEALIDPGDEDWFTFSAKAGQVISADVASMVPRVCVTIVGPDGTVINHTGCPTVAESIVSSVRGTPGISPVTAPVDGTYALSIGHITAAATAYDFTVRVGGATSTRPDMGTPSDPASLGPAQVVVAVPDMGVNPYHEMYYRPQNTQHPCTWVEGFDDCSIPALNLSIGEYDTLAEAVEADRKIWESVQIRQWYWIPRTNIIGAVCEEITTNDPTRLTATGGACIFDDEGHGTQTTSSVLSEEPDALLLVHEGGASASAMPTAPVVPDIESFSWSAYAPLPSHLTLLAPEDISRDFHRGRPFHDQTILFHAAGNDGLFPTVIDGSKVDPNIQIVGGGYPGFWTPRSWTTYDFASWYCRPTADPFTLDGYKDDCGTSFSAPTVAGTAAAALLEIRRRDGADMRSTTEMVSKTVSREKFIEALRAGATYTPEPGRFPNRPEVGDQALVPGAEHLAWGYGWLDRTRINAVVTCALDNVCPAKSSGAEQYNAARQDVRAAQPHD